MQYIWPLFAFFSAPLLVPPLLATAVTFRGVDRRTQDASGGRSKIKHTPQKSSNSSLALQVLTTTLANKYYYPVYLLGTVVLSLAIIRYNTIVHPFTLADNRHYMFYIFRYTVMRPGSARYGLVIAYTTSRWFVWRRLCGDDSLDGPTLTAQHINTPFLTPFLAPGTEISRREHSTTTQSSENSSGTQEGLPTPQQGLKDSNSEPPAVYALGYLNEPTSTSASPPSTSTVLLWLLATTLSLVTAPLVEPRYFILPWVFWRLLVPAWRVPLLPQDSSAAGAVSLVPVFGWLFAMGRKIDLTLALETVWFVLINLGTMYIFLFRPYVWTDADGAVLDSGRLQRFMW